MNYRFDIDGLRALAILAILVFHIDPRFAGGFIGVDIFFVISGFLITGIIWKELQQNTFTFSMFYLKRVRRLFPALFVMLFVAYAFIIVFGLNTEIEMFGKSALSSLYYISNIFFYSQNDYFASDLKLNPLLHTWSLSVEEQFYLFFPLFLYWVYRKKQNTHYYLLGLLFVSFILSEYLLATDASASFFLSPSRFWQFLVGSLLAIYGHKITLSAKQASYLSIVGFLFIAYSLYAFSEHTAFPGVFALIPTLGTAALVLSGFNNNSYSYRLLSSAVPRFFGNISYSLYLWHWPIIVFYKITIAPSFVKEDKVIVFLLSVLAGYISWRLVEKTTAKLSLTQQSRKLLYISTGSLSALTLLGLLCFNSSFFHSQEKQFYENFLSYKMEAKTGSCFLISGDNANAFDEEQCIKQGKKNILLIGDSHAAHYYQGLVNSLPEFTISHASSSGCRPHFKNEAGNRCADLINHVYSNLLNKYQFDLIILAGRWIKMDIALLPSTLQFLNDSKLNVAIFGPVIEYEQALPALLARFGNDAHTSDMLDSARNWQQITYMDNQVSNIAQDANIKYISMLNVMCPKKQCVVTTKQGAPIQSDYGHLTTKGAEIVLKMAINAEPKLFDL